MFTFLANDFEAKFRQIAFSESVRTSHGQHLPPKFFPISAFTLCAPSDMQCDTSSCLCRFHFVGATFGPQEFIRNLKHLSYSTFVILILRKIFPCPSGKLSPEFTSPIAKSTSPGLSDTTFLARCKGGNRRMVSFVNSNLVISVNTWLSERKRRSTIDHVKPT